MPEETVVLYFERPGRENTDRILQAALKRAIALGIDHVVVASTSGRTALRAVELARQTGYPGRLVVVGEHAGFTKPGEQLLSPEARQALESAGARIVIGTHALSSAARAFRLKYGGISILEVVADTLRLFSQGVKVAVECSLMAADAGAVPVDRDIIAVGGTGSGSDSALVLRAANQNRFLDMKIREIIGMPR